MDISTMTLEQVMTRMKEIRTGLEDNSLEPTDELSKEAADLVARKIALEAGAANFKRRNELLNKIKNGIEEAKPVGGDSDDMAERTAFMNYVLNGELDKSVLQRAAEANSSTDLGVMIPKTIQQEIIQAIKAIYGSLYGKVRKLNIHGGVEFPIGEFGAAFNRITETTVSDRQSGGQITSSVKFGYFIGEIRIAKTYLQSILTVPAFERELAKVIAEAYVKAMDKEILDGKGETAHEMEGILTKAGVQSIEFTAAEMADWKKIQEKIFAKIPLAMRNKKYEFVMSAGTYEANIKTLADDNNRPVWTETFAPVDGATTCYFKGHEVTLVEPDLMPDFNTAAAGKVFAMIWVPKEAYAINTNDQFHVKTYEDHETNQFVTKALVVNDGKVLRTDHIYLLKKKAA